MKQKNDFTTGGILLPLLKFVIPVFFALFLQSLYGAVDLLVVGRFSGPADVSAVSTGSQIMMTLTNLISSLSMGTTVFLGQKIGEKKPEEGGQIVGSSIALFAVIGIVFTIVIPVFSRGLAGIMQAPEEAFDLTASYIRICGAGSVVIIAYNLIGSIFRGLGDSRTPLITVLISCVCNIAGDLLLVAVFHMGTSGAAYATVFSQLISVVLSLAIIRRSTLPFAFHRKQIRWDTGIIRRVLAIGIPIALQDLLVGISFLVDLLRIANLQEFAAVHDRDTLGHGHGLLLIMGDHNAGDADLLDDVDELELHFGSELLVEGAHRLVKEQKLRMGCKGSCEGHALALSAGKLVGLSVSEFLHVDKGEHLLDVLLDLVLRHMLLL